MNLVIVSPFPPYRGGISKETEILYHGFSNNNHKVKIVNFKKLYPDYFFPGKSQYEENYINKKNIDVTRILSTINPISWKNTYSYILSLKFDAIIFRFWHPILIPSYIYIINNIKKIKPNVRIYCISDNAFPHENFFILDKYFTRKLFNKFTGIFTMSSNVKKQIERIVDNVPVDNVFFPIKEQFGPPLSKSNSVNKIGISEKFIILYFGLIRKYKGLDILLKAIKKMSIINNDFKLLIVGECYDSKKKYLNLINQLNISDRILWIDKYIDDNEVNLFFSASDVIVLPYKSASQSGIIPLAYNYNKIVVATDIPGLKDFIVNNKTGYLFKNGDYGSLSKILQKIYIEHNFIKSKKDIIKYKKQFSIDSLINKMILFMKK